MINTKIINLFAGPGAGKSTIASGLFHEMKKRGISCDAPYEYPKELAWNESYFEVKDQLYVIANQHRGIVRSYGKVEYIILDSPLLLSLIYKNSYTSDYPANLYGDSFDEFMFELHNKYDNINIFLKRPKTQFEDEGRFHDMSESSNLDFKIINILNGFGVEYMDYLVDDNTVKNILNYLEIE